MGACHAIFAFIVREFRAIERLLAVYSGLQRTIVRDILTGVLITRVNIKENM